jgi:hypothetical protein
MPDTPKRPLDESAAAPRPKRKSSRFKLFGAECYCGLGPDCSMFRIMTPAQRANCSDDMRRTMQTYYKSGLLW